MIIAVDYDDTLVRGSQPNLPLISRLIGAQRQGHTVILWTCREGKSLAEAVDTLAGFGFRPTLINQNAPAAVRFAGHDSRKIYADLYIDDKAVKP
ncbi:MAG: hypothetical protein IKQ10_03820 [Oscillospiraceae bacterium]|nr:hypothetical protein [Oscillospiraceae bacterium]